MLDFSECERIVLSHVQPVATERVSLRQLRGCVLAEDVLVPKPIPPRPASILDGYAVRAGDSSARVVGKVFADGLAGSLGEGEAMYVTTGANVPEGADAVVGVEFTKEVGADSISFPPAARGAAIRQVGSDAKAGDVALCAGTEVGPGDIAVLASVGCDGAVVHRRPIVAVFSTGDELADPGELIAEGEAAVYDSNRPMLLALAEEAHCEVHDLGRVGDSLEATREALRRAVELADVVVSSGGVSRGSKDLVRPLLAELGTVHFHLMKMKPGKPTTFATVGSKLLFGLPGNPASAFACFRTLVGPAIRALSGVPAAGCWLARANVELLDDLQADAERPEFVRATVFAAGGKLVARSTGFQRSSCIASLGQANCFLHLEAGAGKVKAGTQVPCSPFSAIRSDAPAEATGGGGTAAEAAAYRALVQWLRDHTEVQNIDLMNLAGFCRNCLAKWLQQASEAQGTQMTIDAAKEAVYGMPYGEWKKKYQAPASGDKLGEFEKRYAELHGGKGASACAGHQVSAAPAASKGASACGGHHAKGASACGGHHGSAAPKPDFQFGVVTVSDRASRGTYEDRTGPRLVTAVAGYSSAPAAVKIVPDEVQAIRGAVERLARTCAVVLTAGGTGFAPRDVTPEAVGPLIVRPAPGLVHALVQREQSSTGFAGLSRPVAGVLPSGTVVATLPGSPEAAVDMFDAIAETLVHAAQLVQTPQACRCRSRRG